jgi:hypothetical protein
MKTVNRTCWICGDPADSREHKFKKSDLLRSSATWAPSDQPYFFGGDRPKRIQGPGSDLVTFGKILCQSCNSTRSQPFDRAYERFSSWINEQGAALMNEASIDFATIYGPNYQAKVFEPSKILRQTTGLSPFRGQLRYSSCTRSIFSIKRRETV